MAITVYCKDCGYVTDFSECQEIYPKHCPEGGCQGQLFIDGTDVPFNEWLEICEEDAV